MPDQLAFLAQLLWMRHSVINLVSILLVRFLKRFLSVGVTVGSQQDRMTSVCDQLFRPVHVRIKACSLFTKQMGIMTYDLTVDAHMNVEHLV